MFLVGSKLPPFDIVNYVMVLPSSLVTKRAELLRWILKDLYGRNFSKWVDTFHFIQLLQIEVQNGFPLLSAKTIEVYKVDSQGLGAVQCNDLSYFLGPD
jgi:hypothetical protein